MGPIALQRRHSAEIYSPNRQQLHSAFSQLHLPSNFVIPHRSPQEQKKKFVKSQCIAHADDENVHSRCPLPPAAFCKQSGLGWNPDLTWRNEASLAERRPLGTRSSISARRPKSDQRKKHFPTEKNATAAESTAQSISCEALVARRRRDAYSDRLSPRARSGKPVAADPKSSRDHESSFFPPSAYLAPIHKRTGWNTQAYCPLKIALLKTFQKISQSGSPSLGMNRVLAITTLCPWTQSTSDAHPCIQLTPFTRLS